MDLQGGSVNLQASPSNLQVGTNVQPATGIPSGAAPTGSSSPATSSASSIGNTATMGSGVGGSTTTSSPDAVAYYTDLINQLTSQLNSAQGMQSTGINNINNQYDLAVNRANQNQGTVLSGLNTQEAQNQTGRENNIGTINQNAQNAYNSLMRLLGASGAGVSSAAQFGAPQAVSKNASQQRAGADYTFNTNEASIGTARNQANTQYQNALTDLLNQKNQNTETFLTNLLNQEGNLEQQIGSAQVNRGLYGGEPYSVAAQGAGNTTAKVQDIQNQLNDIFNRYATPSYTVNPINVTSPNLASYSVDPTTVKAQTQNPTTDNSYLPYLPQTQQPNILVAGNA